MDVPATPPSIATRIAPMGASAVAVIMGSESDLETMQSAIDVLKRFGQAPEVAVVSAHRTPERMFEFAKSAKSRGIQVIIAGAGGAAHLPGMVSALTTLPVLGVPVRSKVLAGVDSLLSIVQMPAGIPTATFAIGPAGATNAGLFALQILALVDRQLSQELERYRDELRDRAVESSERLSQQHSVSQGPLSVLRSGEKAPKAGNQP